MSSLTALMVIDMIKGVVDPNYGSGKSSAAAQSSLSFFYDNVAQNVQPNIRRLLKGFRDKKRVVVHVRVVGVDPEARDWPRRYRGSMLKRGIMPCHAGLSHYEWVEGLEPLGGEIVLEKRSISVFSSTGAELILKNLGVEKIFLAGVATNYGVGHSAIDAVDRGFEAVVVDDACGSYTPELHSGWIALNRGYYLDVLSTKDALSTLDSEIAGAGQ